MLLEIFSQFNWVDFVIIAFAIRVCFMAARNGISIELFKLLGTVFAVYVSAHYYTIFSDWLNSLLPEIPEVTPLEFMDFIAFAILVVATYGAFVLLRSIFYRFIKMEALPHINRWGGFLLGAARAYLFTGIVVYMMVISSVGYLKNSAVDSYFGKFLFPVAPNTYSWLWNNLGSKFIPSEKFNRTITEVREGIEK